MSLFSAVWADDYSYYIAPTLNAADAYRYEITGEFAHRDDYPFKKVPSWKVLARWDGETGEGKLRKRWAWVWVFTNRDGLLMEMEN